MKAIKLSLLAGSAFFNGRLRHGSEADLCSGSAVSVS